MRVSSLLIAVALAGCGLSEKMDKRSSSTPALPGATKEEAKATTTTDCPSFVELKAVAARACASCHADAEGFRADVLDKKHWAPAVEMIVAGKMPPGAPLPDAERARFAHWAKIDFPEARPATCTSNGTAWQASADSAVARRLTPTEYGNVIKDSFGADVSDLVASFPLEASTSGFRNHLDALRISDVHARWFANAAKDAAKRLAPGLVNAKLDEIGLKLFRRPLTDAERAAFESLAKIARDNGETPEGVTRLTLQAMLQSPPFLYRVEAGGTKPTAYEIATRLSFFLWHSAPDAPLLAAAAEGKIDTAEGRKEQIVRMLADPRARRAFRSYVGEWLQLGRLAGVDRDKTKFPEFSPQLIADMREETLRLFEDAAFVKKSDMLGIFATKYTFATPALARLYGLTPGKDGFQTYVLDNKHRGGLLSLSAFLTLSSATASSDPVARGHIVSDRFLCVKTKTPPQGVALEAEKPGNKPKTKRERYDQHRTDQACAGCHRNLDPIGFAFEHFDTLGRFREIDESGTTVDPSGVFPEGAEDKTVKGAVDIGKSLAASPTVRTCVAKRMMEYALGYEVDATDQELAKVTARFEAEGRKFEALILAIVESRAMLEREDDR